MTLDLQRTAAEIGSTLFWTFVSILLVVIVIEFMNWRYHLLDDIFKQNSVAAAILAGSFVLGIFYAVAQIVTH